MQFRKASMINANAVRRNSCKIFAQITFKVVEPPSSGDSFLLWGQCQGFSCYFNPFSLCMQKCQQTRIRMHDGKIPFEDVLSFNVVTLTYSPRFRFKGMTEREFCLATLFPDCARKRKLERTS
ncbi:unnamed protein product [Allacma fusca]|uniref:Uncharacterized protein n=1 Tax=Allacma fusca TaxID=39272 RepID=A0A8J2JG61_9HEXA|nr:unnamed protein product [Allacma fusca]